MYSVKEKMRLLRELHNPEHAGADLRLLREVSPLNDLLRSPIVNAARSAEKILYSLLDQTTAERIRLNRRGMEVEIKPENEPNNEKTREENPANTDPGQPNPAEQPVGNPAESPGEDHPDGNAGKDDVAQQLEEKTGELEETQEILESTQAELEETREELEDKQAELEMTQAELEAEKKSELIPEPAP